MRSKTVSTLFLPLVFTASALGSPRLAVGPNAVVPDGAPLPLAYNNHGAGCNALGTCGSICPSLGSVFIGDMGYDIAAGQFYVIDVNSAFSIFTMDGNCALGPEFQTPGQPQRGCAYDNSNGVIYTNSWVDQKLWYYDTSYNLIGSESLKENWRFGISCGLNSLSQAAGRP